MSQLPKSRCASAGPRLFVTVIVWLAAAVLAPVSGASPQVEHALTLDTGLSNESQPQLTVYFDRDDSHVFWWAPFQLAIEKAPVTGIPRLTWTAYDPVPRITLVASLERLPVIVEHRILAGLSTATGLPAADIELRPLQLEDVNFVVTVGADDTLIVGDWLPQTSLVVQNVPETIELTADENADLLASNNVGLAGTEVTMNFAGTFSAYRTASHYSREYEPACVGREVLGQGTLAEALSKKWDGRRLFSLAAKVQNNCVRKYTVFGTEPSLYELVGDWRDQLVGTGLFTEGVNQALQITSAAAFSVFIGRDDVSFTVEIPETLASYPVTFGRLATELQPTN